MNKALLATAALAAASMGASGCVATHAGMAFESSLTPAEEKAAKKGDPGKAKAFIAPDFDTEIARKYAEGYELVGYSKFVSSLKPRFAKTNARIAARRLGASVAVMKAPQPAFMGQHRYLFTFWRKADGAGLTFGGQYDDLDPRISAVNGCAANLVTLNAVSPNSPAARMGLLSGDAIIDVNGTPVRTARQLDDLLYRNAGGEVEIRYVRGDESRVAVGTLGPVPAEAAEVKPVVDPVGLKLVHAELPKEMRRKLRRKGGVYVDGVAFGTYACGGELRQGDMIVAAGGKRIKTPQDVADQIAKSQGRTLNVRVLRGGVERDAVLDFSQDLDERIAYFERRAMPESDLAVPPWETAKTKNYTWMTVTALAIQGAIKGYNNYLESERQRIADYNRRQALAASAGPDIYKDRNGVVTVGTATGDRVRINAETAQMLKANPGFTVSSTRRGGLGGIYDRYGNSVPVPAAPIVIQVGPPPAINMAGIYANYMKQVGISSAWEEMAQYPSNPWGGSGPSSIIAQQPSAQFQSWGSVTYQVYAPLQTSGGRRGG
ncbi:MAG: PDZ domain-containing protein [Pseudomonadota bacterium]